jgi:hypothetical protein
LFNERDWLENRSGDDRFRCVGILLDGDPRGDRHHLSSLCTRSNSWGPISSLRSDDVDLLIAAGTLFWTGSMIRPKRSAQRSYTSLQPSKFLVPSGR